MFFWGEDAVTDGLSPYIDAAPREEQKYFLATQQVDEARSDRLPGFRAGMENVSADEQRHIGFGVKLLSELAEEDPDCRHAVADLLREVIPWTGAVLVPPRWDERYVECFGFTLEDLGEAGASSLETKMRSAGLPLDGLPGPPVFPVPGTPRERAARGKKLIKAGYLGEKVGPPSTDPDDMETLFESIAAGFDTDAAPYGGGVLQWKFPDAEPWHVVVANGATRHLRKRAQSPTVTFRSRFEDWVDTVAGREDRRRLLATRRLRVRGNYLWLWRARGMFPR